MVGRTLDWKEELGRWLKPFLDRLGHKARRQMCPLYVSGLIGPGDRKSIQPMAERLALGEYDQLLGGKCRFAVDCYAHSSGRDNKELEESVKRNVERGFRHIRLQVGGYGSGHLSKAADFKEAGFGMPQDTNMEFVSVFESHAESV